MRRVERETNPHLRPGRAQQNIPSGEHQARIEFDYDGGGLGKGGTVTRYPDGQQVGRGRVEGTVPMLFAAGETTDSGSDSATAVSDDYGPKDGRFTGSVRCVQIGIDEAAEDLAELNAFLLRRL